MLMDECLFVRVALLNIHTYTNVVVTLCCRRLACPLLPQSWLSAFRAGMASESARTGYALTLSGVGAGAPCLHCCTLA